MSVSFDFAPDLPVPVKSGAVSPKYNFIGGHNDAERVPVDALIAAADLRSQARGHLRLRPMG